MRRSEINSAIDEAITFFDKAQFPLPPFAYWGPHKWRLNKQNEDEIRKVKLGWDVTDFGTGNFKKYGRTIFTLRNGVNKSKKYTKSYSQKVMYIKSGQKSPVHYHGQKTEDIINHYGGTIIVNLWKKTKRNRLSRARVSASLDGFQTKFKAGEDIPLLTGSSITIKPSLYHQFYAKKKNGPVVSIEIGSVNNDLSDNYWLEKVKRFPKIAEDTKKRYILCSEYA